MGRPIYAGTQDTQCSSSSSSSVAATKTADATLSSSERTTPIRNVDRERRARLNRILSNSEHDPTFLTGTNSTQPRVALSFLNREAADERSDLNNLFYDFPSTRFSYTPPVRDTHSRPRPSRPLRRAPPISHAAANMMTASGAGEPRRHYGHWLSQPLDNTSDEALMHHFGVTRSELLSRYESTRAMAERATPDRSSPLAPEREQVREQGQEQSNIEALGTESSSENQPPSAPLRVQSPSRMSPTASLSQYPRGAILSRILFNSRQQRTRAQRNRMAAMANSSSGGTRSMPYTIGPVLGEDNSTTSGGNSSYARMFSPTYSPDVLFTDDEGPIESGDDDEEEETDESFGRIQAERMMERMAARQRAMSVLEGRD